MKVKIMANKSRGVNMPLETKRHIAEVAKTSSMTRKELAKRFNTSTRTLYRIIKEMESVEPLSSTDGFKIVGVNTTLKFVDDHMVASFGVMHKGLSLATELEKVNLQTVINQNAHSLDTAFNWHSTPQGFKFWSQFDAYNSAVGYRIKSNCINVNELGKEIIEFFPNYEYLLSHWYVPLGIRSTRETLQTIDRIYGTCMFEKYKTECFRRVKMLTKAEREVIKREVGMSKLFDIKISDFPKEQDVKYGVPVISKIKSDNVDWFGISRKVNRLLAKVNIKAANGVLERLSCITKTEYKNRDTALKNAVLHAAYDNNIYAITQYNLEQLLDMINPALSRELSVDQHVFKWLMDSQMYTHYLRDQLVEYAIVNNIEMKSCMFKTFAGCKMEPYKKLIKKFVDRVCIEKLVIYKTIKDRFHSLHPYMSLKAELSQELQYALEHGKSFNCSNQFPNVFDLKDCAQGEQFWTDVWNYRPERTVETIDATCINDANSYVITPSNVNFVVNGKSYSAGKSHPNFDKIVSCVMNGEYEPAIKLLDIIRAIKEFVGEETIVQNGVLTYHGVVIKNSMVDRIIDAMANGEEQKTSNYVKFFERLMENPDKDVIERLFDFLQAKDIKIDNNGYIIAWKRVTDDYRDFWTGTIDNSIGTVVKMPRYMVNCDSNISCAAGLHVCSESYLPRYNGGKGVIIICKINPRDVCAVPKGSVQKMRVCKYKVLSKK